MVLNLCSVSRGMGVRKVSNSKSDLQGHSRTLAIVPFDSPRPALDILYLHTKIGDSLEPFQDASYSCNRTLIGNRIPPIPPCISWMSDLGPSDRPHTISFYYNCLYLASWNSSSESPNYVRRYYIKC